MKKKYSSKEEQPYLPYKTPMIFVQFGGGWWWWWWWCGGGGGGGECQRIKVLRSRVYPLGQLPTIK